jgi:hypothetical protein
MVAEDPAANRGSAAPRGGNTSTLFEAEAAAVAAFRHQGWATDALTPNAVLHIEVQLPPITHDVPLKAIGRWLRTPSVSPREAMANTGAEGGARVTSSEGARRWSGGAFAVNRPDGR